MKAIIAERPFVAREIARIVGATKREEGYFERGGYAVTWTFGHLVQLTMPNGYGIRRFVRDNPPIIPGTFTLVPRQVGTEKGYEPGSGVVSQIKIIKRLFDASEQIIVAIDTGREGELIFRYLYHYTGSTAPFVRLWINSFTDEATREGLRNLEDSGKYDNLHLAAKVRSESDWLVGINGTQAPSIAAGHGTYSVERVQTPTLTMMCKRYWENRRFTPEAFWQLHIATDDCGGRVVKLSSSEKWKSREPATELYNKVKATGFATIAKAERKEETEDTPLLYDLTTLQEKTSAEHGFTAEQTLEIVQKLYKKKLMTYPRTGNRYIPEDMFAEIPKLLAFIDTQPEQKNKMWAKTTPTCRSADDDKVTDHHALLVTGRKPLFLSEEDSTIYQMIAGRMMEAFSEKCVKGMTAVMAERVGMRFTVKGGIIRQAGWRAIYGEENKDETIIPGWQEGDTLTLKTSSITEGRIRPKPLHTGATLLSVMKMVDKEIEDNVLWRTMKDYGVGTPATRASIIEALFRRGYMKRCKKSLVPTEKGFVLNPVVKTTRIADVAMASEWEKELTHIEHEELSADTFHKKIEAYMREIISELLSYDRLFDSRGSGCACPRCGTGRMRFYGKVVRCGNTECRLLVFRLKARHALSNDEIKDLLTDGHTRLLKSFKSEQGKSFDAMVTFNRDYNTAFASPGKKYRSSYPKKGK